MSLLGSGTAQPCLGAVPAHSTSRLLAFLPCRSFPGHPGKERNRWAPPTQATVVPGECSQNRHMGLHERREGDKTKTEVPWGSLLVCVLSEKWAQGMSQLL